MCNKITVYTLCDKCNKEFELKLEDYNGLGFFYVFGICPYCDAKNNRWLRIKLGE